MDLLLGSKEYLKAVNKDYQLRIDLSQNTDKYRFPSINKTIDELKQFTLERNACTKYVLYGKLDNICDIKLEGLYGVKEGNYNMTLGYIDRYIVEDTSIIDIIGVEDNYIELKTTKINNNDVILVLRDGRQEIRKVLEKKIKGENILIRLDKMDSISSKHKIVPSKGQYKRFFKEIFSERFINVFNSAYSTNIFGEQILQFNTYKDVDVSGLVDNFNIPITELLLRVKPTFEHTSSYKGSSVRVDDQNLVDIIEFDLNSLERVIMKEVTYNFKHDNLDFFFVPFIKFQTKVYSENVTNANNLNLFTIPDYSFKFENGDILFREILDIGVFENEKGVDYPFMNKLHYIYKDVKLFIRRVTPKPGTYDLIQDLNDEYASSLVGEDITQKRLC